MICTPQNDYEALSCDIMRRIIEGNLLKVDVRDCDVDGDSDLLERSVSIRWSSQTIEQLSAVIAEHFEVIG